MCCVCVAAAGPLLIPLQAHSSRTSFSTLKSCPQLVSARSVRHNILCATRCQFMQSAGLGCSLEPNCSKVARSNPVTSAGNRAHILCVLQDRVLLSDISLSHYCTDAYVETAAATAGSATEVREAKKVSKYVLCKPGGSDFRPLVVAFYGRQCPATHTLQNILGRLAADSGRGSRARCGD